MLLTRKSDRISAAGPRLRRLAGVPLPAMDRRTFLKRSGLAASAGAFASQLPYGAIGKAEAAKEGATATEVKRTVCTHCSVGCSVDAIVENGVWTRQEPVFELPAALHAWSLADLLVYSLTAAPASRSSHPRSTAMARGSCRNR